MRKMLFVAMLGSGGFLFSQTVCIRTSQQCIEAQKKECASAPTPQNFELSGNKIVEGMVSDKTGASIQGVDVQLRVPETGRVLRSVGAKDGTFYLVKVRAGSYRLIVVKQEKQRVERLALADQPKLLVCSDSTSVCQLSVAITFRGTDDTIDFCPPK